MLRTRWSVKEKTRKGEEDGATWSLADKTQGMKPVVVVNSSTGSTRSNDTEHTPVPTCPASTHLSPVCKGAWPLEFDD